MKQVNGDFRYEWVQHLVSAGPGVGSAIVGVEAY